MIEIHPLGTELVHSLPECGYLSEVLSLRGSDSVGEIEERPSFLVKLSLQSQNTLKTGSSLGLKRFKLRLVLFRDSDRVGLVRLGLVN